MARAAITAFINNIYSRLAASANGPEFDEMGIAAPIVFDSTMVRVSKENRRLTPSDEAGSINYDPLCNCQDTAGLRVRVRRIDILGSTEAQAVVGLWVTEAKPDGSDWVQLTLKKENGEWKIHDIQSKMMASLLAFLQNDNAQRRLRSSR